MQVCVIDSDPTIVAWFEAALAERAAVHVAYDVKSAERLFCLRRPDLIFLGRSARSADDWLPIARCHASSARIVMMADGLTGLDAAEKIQGGAFDVIQRPPRAEDVTRLIDRAQAEDLGDAYEARTEDDVRLGQIATRSSSVKSLFEIIRTAAPTNVNVLVLGENGAGKELVASVIHDLSPRRDRPFVRINCAALPDELLESELFGHRRGSFTGAVSDRVGLLAHAHGGSVLLDEIAEMSVTLQAKLLRVLQDKEVRAVGDTRSTHVDFRLVCATNADPKTAIATGRLREDLFFRINTVTLRMPPLRERLADVPLLAHAFLEKFTRAHGRAIDGFEPAALRFLVRHVWPGNIRELEHAIESAVIIAKGRRIRVADLPESVRLHTVRLASDTLRLPLGCSLDELERLAILQALEHTEGNKRAAAKMLGIHRPTLYSKLRKHGLDRASAPGSARAWPRRVASLLEDGPS